MRRYANLLAVLALSTNLALHAQTNELVIQTKKLGAEIQPTMYGLFFEDINYAADGGLYAELVKNRSFEFPQHLMGWKTYGKVSLMNDGPFERNPHYVRLSDPGHAHKHTGLDNEGFFGIGVKKGNTELKNKINNAITDMIQDGSWQRAISDNTRGVAYTPNAKYNPPVPNGKGNK